MCNVLKLNILVCLNFKLIYRPKLRVKQINVPNMNEISVSLRKQIKLFEGMRLVIITHFLDLVVKAGTAHFPLCNLKINHTTYDMVVSSIQTFYFYEAISEAQV